MLLIDLSFFYLFLLLSQLGIGFSKVFKLENSAVSNTLFNGFLVVAALSGTWAFFGRINWEFQLVLGIFAGLSAVIFRKESIAFYRNIFDEINQLPRFLLAYFVFSGLLILAKSATAPYLPDNESYYIQTIKWLNEKGFVPGLANLHFFFGQTSGWHIIQSALNLNFLYDRFNDLSGFVLIAGNYWAVLRLHAYFQNPNRTDLTFGLFGIANVLWLQFCASPSPDVPVYVIGFMVSHLFISSFNQWNKSVYLQLWCLIILAVWCKITALPLVLFPIIYAIKHAQFKSLFQAKFLGIGSLFLLLFLGKNAVLTGHYFFPFIGFTHSTIHTVPEIVLEYFNANSRPMAFGLDISTYDNSGPLQLLKRWLTLPGLHGLMNFLSFIGLIVSGIILVRSKDSPWKWIWFVGLIQFLLLYAVSPQYRFGLHFTILFGLFIAASILFKFQKIIRFGLYASVVIAAIPLFIPLSLGKATENNLMQENPVFQVSQLVIPHGNSASNTTFEMKSYKGLPYNAPIEPTFFWFTGNGPIPSVNTAQLEFMETNLGVRPIETQCGYISVIEDEDE